MTCLATAAFGLEAPDATVTHTFEPTYKVRVEALTDFPVQLGVGAVVEGPLRLRARTSVGVLPATYVRVINDVVQRFDPYYTEDTAELVEATLQRSLVWRTHLGWDIALDEHWTLRAALGWSYTFNAKTTLEADKSGLGPARQRGLQTLERAGEFYLDDIFQSYVHPPSLVFGVGYVF